jgi:hypothetical protein
MRKETLQILTAFTIMSRRAVDRLRDEYYGGRSYPREAAQLRSALDKLRSDALTDALKAGDADYAQTAHQLAEALFEQLMLSHQMMVQMYSGASGSFLHSHLLGESCARAETILGKVLDLRSVVLWARLAAI